MYLCGVIKTLNIMDLKDISYRVDDKLKEYIQLETGYYKNKKDYKKVIYIHEYQVNGNFIDVEYQTEVKCDWNSDIINDTENTRIPLLEFIVALTTH